MKNRRAPARRREQLGSGARARETTAGHLDASDPQAQPDVGPARVGARPGALTPRDVLRLQRTLGNRALNRLRQEPALPLPAAPVRRPLFGQAPTYAPRPARALQRIVVTQIVPGAGDLIGDVFVAGRPPNTFGSSMGDHTTAFTTHVNAVRAALAGKSAGDAIVALDRLVAGIRELPGYALAPNLPPKIAAKWKAAGTHLETIRGELQPPKDGAASDQAAMVAKLQEYVSAYLELRELVPLSTINVGQKSQGSFGKGKGESADPLREHVQGQKKSPAELWESVLGLFDFHSVTWAAIEQDAAKLAEIAPGLDHSLGPMERAELMARQHIRTIRLGYPGVLGALADATPGAAPVSDEALEEAATAKLVKALRGSIAGGLAREIPFLEHNLDQYINDYEKTEDDKGRTSLSEKFTPIQERLKKIYALVGVSKEPRKPQSKPDILAPRPRRNSTKKMHFDEQQDALEARNTQQKVTEQVKQLTKSQGEKSKKRKAEDLEDPAKKKPKIEGKGISSDSREAEDLSSEKGEAGQEPQLTEEELAELAEMQGQLAIQVVLDKGGTISEIRSAGRPKSPLSGTMGAHTTAWTVHLDRVRTALHQKTVAQALDVVESQLMPEIAEMQGRLGEAFGSAAGPPTPAAGDGLPGGGDDTVMMESGGDTTAESTTMPGGSGDAILLDSDTSSTKATTGTPGTSDDAMSLDVSAAPLVPQILQLQQKINRFLAAANQVPGATLGAADIGGKREADHRRVLLEHLGLLGVPKVAHSQDEVKAAILGLLDVKAALPDPEILEKKDRSKSTAITAETGVSLDEDDDLMSGLTTTTGEPVAAESGGDDYEMEDEVDVRIDQSKKPIDALVYNHLLVIEKAYPGALAAAGIPAPTSSADVNALAGVVEKAALDDRKSKTRGRSKSTKKDGTSDGTMADSSGAWQLSDTLFGAAPGSKSSDLGGPSGTGAPALGMLDRNLRTPQVLLNFDKLAIDNTWLDQHGNLLDDHLDEFKDAYLADMALPGTYLAEGEGTLVADHFKVTVNVHQGSVPEGFQQVANVGGGDCLIHALSDVKRAHDLETGGTQLAAIPNLLGTAPARAVPGDQIIQIRKHIAETMDPNTVTPAVQALVRAEVDNRPEPGVYPKLQGLMNSNPFQLAKFMVQQARLFEEAKKRIEEKKKPSAPSKPPETSSKTEPVAAQPVVAAPQSQYGSGAALLNQALLHVGGNHYVLLQRVPPDPSAAPKGGEPTGEAMSLSQKDDED